MKFKTVQKGGGGRRPFFFFNISFAIILLFSLFSSSEAKESSESDCLSFLHSPLLLLSLSAERYHGSCSDVSAFLFTSRPFIFFLLII